MPMIDADGCLLNVSVEGRDGGPTLMLSNSLGCTLQMWEPQMKALTQLFRVVRYDRRGHGKYGVPPGPYSMERFGKDALAILDDLNIEKAHWCGLSMGGMVGQWLGANAPERLGKIILANTTCHFRPHQLAQPHQGGDGRRPRRDRRHSHRRLADRGFPRARAAGGCEFEGDAAGTPVKGYLACCEALSSSISASCCQVKSPTLIIAGRHDMGTTVAAGEFMRSRIPAPA